MSYSKAPKQRTLESYLKQFTRQNAMGTLGVTQKQSTSKIVSKITVEDKDTLPAPKRKREEDADVHDISAIMSEKDEIEDEAPPKKIQRIIEVDEVNNEASTILNSSRIDKKEAGAALDEGDEITIPLDSPIIPIKSDLLRTPAHSILSPSKVHRPLILSLDESSSDSSSASIELASSLLRIPPTYVDAWDDSHARLPSSPFYLRNGDRAWPRIVSLLSPLAHGCRERPATIAQLESAIRSYSSVKRGFDMSGLSSMLSSISGEERSNFFAFTLPYIASLVVHMPETLSQPVRLLRAHSSSAVSLTQHQCATLVAAGFCCAMPPPHMESFAYFNFHNLFSSPVEASNVQKLRCFVHYFERRRLLQGAAVGTVAFARISLSATDVPAWKNNGALLNNVNVQWRLNGNIEDDHEALQADFANKRIGGGVLASGCVQEEIRFAICPELLVSRLISEDLEANEALVVIGMERYCSYSGYASSFTFTGNYIDAAGRDHHDRLLNRLVAFDALHYSQANAQFRPDLIRRELLKACAAFTPAVCEYLDDPQIGRDPIATGNWGCGAFRGDRELKCIIQVLAAAQYRRSLHYFTFGDEELLRRGSSLMNLMSERNASIGSVLSLLDEYYSLLSQGDFSGGVFDFLDEVYSSH